jgi:hypothetical protein
MEIAVSDRGVEPPHIVDGADVSRVRSDVQPLPVR